jgi:hypothetical protein
MNGIYAVKVIRLWLYSPSNEDFSDSPRMLQYPMVQRLAGLRVVVTGIGSFGARAHSFSHVFISRA